MHFNKKHTHTHTSTNMHTVQMYIWPTNALHTNTFTRGRRRTNTHTYKRKYMIYKREVSFDRLISKLLCWNRCCCVCRSMLGKRVGKQHDSACVCLCVDIWTRRMYTTLYTLYRNPWCAADGCWWAAVWIKTLIRIWACFLPNSALKHCWH